jgi:5-dehydro-2-deoxygluconokinase
MNAAVKRLDVICIGRVAVDLYAQQIGSRLEDVASFAKYLGGSSGNVAFGTAIQGLKSAMLARVGDEHNGRFLRETLNRAGVDTEYLITDKSRLTALVMLGIKDQETFPLIFYRDNCADMALTPDDISEEYIASSRALAVTGTHLSHANTRAAVLKALEYARRHGLRTALDIDYRPVLWGLTSLGDGETRFIESGRSPASCRKCCICSIWWWEPKKSFILPGQHRYPDRAEKCAQCHQSHPRLQARADGLRGAGRRHPGQLGPGAAAAGRARGGSQRAGRRGCLYVGPAARLAQRRRLGAGLPLRQRLRGAGGLRHGCAPAMPTKVELDDYLQRAESVPRPDVDERLNHLHRVTSRRQQWPELCIFAFDHRKQLADLARRPGAMKPAFRSSSCCCWPRPKRRRRRRVSISAAAFWPTAPTASVRSTPLPARAGGSGALSNCPARDRCVWSMATSARS